MTRAKHTAESRVSYRSLTMEIDGVQVVGGFGSMGRVACSCGWDSGPMATGEAASEAFKKHKRAAGGRRR